MKRISFRFAGYFLVSVLVAAAAFSAFSFTAAAAEEKEGEEEKYYVEYNCMEGYREIDGERRTTFALPYDPGSPFDPVEPVPVSDQYQFGGWFSRTKGRGDPLTEETVVDRDGIRAYAFWQPDPSAISGMVQDTVYPIEISAGATLMSFTPSETASYEITTMGNDPEMSIANIRILDGSLTSLAESRSIDYDYNALVSMEMTAGTTYYIEFCDVFGSAVSFDAVLKRSEFVEVTFHANCETAGEAWFDGDPSVTEKTMSVPKGTRLEDYKESGLEIDPSADMELDGWSLDPGALEPEEEIILEEPVDLYAVYFRYQSVTLDSNGGYFDHYGEKSTQFVYDYQPDNVFGVPFEPVIDDEGLMFSGWARMPDGEAEIHAGQTCGDLGEVLYAVWSEPVTVTFDAAGGNIYGNPELKTISYQYGKGHAFYPVHVEHDDPQMAIIGWRDQNGELIPATAEANPDYLYMEDTRLTAVWGRYLLADANGGCYHWNENYTKALLLLPADDPFDSSYITEVSGDPIHMNDLKYLAGWASTPDAGEADILDGTEIPKDLSVIYAVWKDDSYYLAGGADQSFSRGSSKGLTFTVKRENDDTMTFSCFESVSVDGESVEYPLFTRKEGSSILTLTPAFLETLADGEHTIAMNFTEDQVVETAFTVTSAKDPSDEEDDPDDEDTDPYEEEEEPTGGWEDPSDADGVPSPGEKDPSENKAGASGRERHPGNPDTGDHTQTGCWLAILGASACVILISLLLLAVRRRRS